jgi:DNA repair protein RadC
MTVPSTCIRNRRERATSELSDAELLALVLGHPLLRPRTLRRAERLLGQSGSLRSLIGACSDPFAHPGSSPALWRTRLQAAQELVLRSMRQDLGERAALGSPAQVRQFLCLWLRDKPSEHFAGLFLDAQHRLIAAELLFNGTVSQTAVYPREVARRALALNAAAVIVAHNHPSGAAEPSAADRLLTDRLRDALQTLDVPVIDHFIVAGNRCFSFAEAGLMN